MAVLTRREVDDGVRARLRLLSKVEFRPFFQCWLKGSKEEFDPYSEDLRTIDSQVDEETFRFLSGRRVSVISE